MHKILFLTVILFFLLLSSAYANEPPDYLWQQETASCLVDENCTIPDNQSRDKRKKCIRLAEDEGFKDDIIVVGDSCSAGKETAEEVVKILSALSVSVEKSFAEIEVDFDPFEAFAAALLYVPVNKIVQNKKEEKQAADKKNPEHSAEKSTEQQQADIVPVLLVRFKKDLYFNFNSSELKEIGSIITQHFVHDVLAAATAYKNITVIGHADSVGTDRDNMTLSKERSDATVAELQKEIEKAGGSPNALQIESLGVGETQPIEYLEQEKKSAANRRVEIFLSPSSIALHRAEKYLHCLYRNKAKAKDESGDEADKPDEADKFDQSGQVECFTRYMTLQAE
ncbi:MAG: OmpA family protein [Candidatus Electrothrix sp. YB6]